jgi:integrase
MSIRRKLLKSKTPDGKPRYSYEVRLFRADRPAPISKSFKDLAMAKQWQTQAEAKLDRGLKVTLKAESFTFAQACLAFYLDYRPRRKDNAPSKLGAGKKAGDPVEVFKEIANPFVDDKGVPIDSSPAIIKTRLSAGDRRLVARIGYDLGGYRINMLTNERIQAYVDLLLTTPIDPPANKKKDHPYYNGAKVRLNSESTVRHHYYSIKKVLEWHSLKEGYPLEESTFRNHDIPSSWAGKRERRLEEGELDKLHDAIMRGYAWKAEWKLIIDWALRTGARAQEILKSKWVDVNVKGQAWNIPPENVKTSTFRQVALPSKTLALVAELEKFKKPGEDRIFWMWANSNVLSTGFKRITVRAKIDNFTFHDLRHEGISRLFEDTTMSDAEIMTMTGHTNIRTLEGYMKLRPSYLANKMEAITR